MGQTRRAVNQGPWGLDWESNVPGEVPCRQWVGEGCPPSVRSVVTPATKAGDLTGRRRLPGRGPDGGLTPSDPRKSETGEFFPPLPSSTAVFRCLPGRDSLRQDAAHSNGRTRHRTATRLRVASDLSPEGLVPLSNYDSRENPR